MPGDPEKPSVTSGLRLGTSAATARGLGTAEMQTVAHLVADVLDALCENRTDNTATADRVRAYVNELSVRFPIYPNG